MNPAQGGTQKAGQSFQNTNKIKIVPLFGIPYSGTSPKKRLAMTLILSISEVFFHLFFVEFCVFVANC
jgi:hypothetical protein